jgi:quercetin dioxygenase-like cupin family protein
MRFLQNKHLSAAALVCAACFVLLACVNLFTQQSPLNASRKILDRHDLSVPGREGVLVQTQLDPGAREPSHTHPGDIFAYVLEGDVTLFQEGQPTKHLTVGESFFVPQGAVHGAANEGTAPVKLLVTFFVEKGKPLTTSVK